MHLLSECRTNESSVHEERSAWALGRNFRIAINYGRYVLRANLGKSENHRNKKLSFRVVRPSEYNSCKIC